MEFSSNLSAIYTKRCAQTFPPILGLFAILDSNFAKIVATPSDEYENNVARLKVQSLPKKTVQTSSKSACKRPLLEHTALRTRSVTKKHHIFAPTAGERCTIVPKLCTVIELVVPIIKGVIHFSIQCIVFVHTSNTAERGTYSLPFALNRGLKF